MSMPWLSVILPTYNGAAYLESALQSLAAQQEGDFEVVVVDDGSTDTTREILDAYRNSLPMRIIHGEHTGNWVATTNRGMSLARGRYLGWLHQDDAWDVRRLRELKRLTIQQPESVLFFHPSYFIDSTGMRLGVWRCPFPRRTARLPSGQVLERLLVQNFLCASATLFRSDAACRIGTMDETLWYTADWDFWLRLARLGSAIYHPAPLASFRIHPASQTSSCAARIDDVVHQYEIVLARHADALPPCAPHSRRVLEVAAFSVALNLALMRLSSRRRIGALYLLRRALKLGPDGWYRFFRDSRILDRCMARLRARFSTSCRRTHGTS